MVLIENKSQFLFEEKQNLNNWIIWVILGITFSGTAAILFYQLITGNAVGNHPASNGLLIGVLFFHVIGISLVIYAKLIVQIDKDVIYYGFNIPTSDINKIKLSDIQSLAIIQYSFVGYGYRLSGKYGTVYNTSGNKGLQIITKSGEKILLGTQKPKELQNAIEKINLSQESRKQEM